MKFKPISKKDNNYHEDTPIQFTPLDFFIQLGSFFLRGQAKAQRYKAPKDKKNTQTNS